MSKRLFGIIGTLWLVLGPLAALWLIVHFAFGGVDPVAETLAALVILGPPVVCAILYSRYMRSAE